MTVYLIFYLAIFALAFVNLYISKEKMKPIYYAILVIIIIAVGFRKNLGGSDYFVYKAYFDAVPPPWDLGSFHYFVHYRIFYELLNSTVKVFTNNFVGVTFVIALFTLTMLFTQSYKYMKYPFFAFSFYIYKTFLYTNLIILRQSIAMMIFFFAIRYIINKKFAKYMITILIASLFHTSALILLPLYFLNRVDFSKYNPFIFVSGGLVLSIISKYILMLILVVVKLVHLPSIIAFKVGQMISGTQGVFNPHMIEVTLYIILFNCIRKISMTKEDKVFYNLFIVYASTLFMFSRFSIFIRLSMYFYISIMYLMSRRLELVKKPVGKVLFVYILGFIFLLGFIKYLVTFDVGGLMPYRWIFTQGLGNSFVG